jgi:virginiamycin B lyase
MSAVRIDEHRVCGPDDGPYGLTTGPDGALWVTLVHSGRLARLVPGGTPELHRLALEIGALGRVSRVTDPAGGGGAS